MHARYLEAAFAEMKKVKKVNVSMATGANAASKKWAGRVAIIGTGVMGAQVAEVCAAHGIAVSLYDTSLTIANQAAAHIDKRIRATNERSPELRVATTLVQAICDADVVLENVPEYLELKRSVYMRIEACKPPSALIGSNTSSLTWSELAEALKDKSKFFLMNFTAPRTHRLVEYMDGPETSTDTKQRALAFARSIGMVPVPVRKEVMGYVGNRIWRAVKKEVLYLLENGYATAEEIDRAYMLGNNASYGPCALMDQIGLHSVLRVEENYFSKTGYESDRPPKVLRDLVKQGKLGVASGQGFFSYPNPTYGTPSWLEGCSSDQESGT